MYLKQAVCQYATHLITHFVNARERTRIAADRLRKHMISRESSRHVVDHAWASNASNALV